MPDHPTGARKDDDYPGTAGKPTRSGCSMPPSLVYYGLHIAGFFFILFTNLVWESPEQVHSTQS